MVLNDEILDKMERLANVMKPWEMRLWERYFADLLLEEAYLETHVIKGVFRHAERQHCHLQNSGGSSDVR